ncbi:MAG: hypothetical protein IRY94_08940, partial [Rhodospirillaceae bacterium]|nr:hypothetical protein [Rhodospirillaceae bacterium]
MTAIRKFHFDVSFDAGQDEPEEAAPPPPPERRFSEEELAAERTRAFAEGRAAGQTEARASIDNACAQALPALSEQAGQLVDAQKEADARNARAAVATAVAVVRKLFPELARRNGLVEVEGVLARCLETMRPEPRIVVRLHDSLLDPLRERLDVVAAGAGFEGRIVI